MTCYQRHLGWLFEALDVPFEKDGRRRVDDALHAALGLAPEAHCPEVWAAYKALSDEARDALVPTLRGLLAG